MARDGRSGAAGGSREAGRMMVAVAAGRSKAAGRSREAGGMMFAVAAGRSRATRPKTSTTT